MTSFVNDPSCSSESVVTKVVKLYLFQGETKSAPSHKGLVKWHKLCRTKVMKKVLGPKRCKKKLTERKLKERKAVWRLRTKVYEQSGL